MAIEDSVVLVRCLKGIGSLRRNLATFVAERFARTTSVTNRSLRFRQIGHWQGRWSCWMRDRLFGIVLPLVEAKGLTQYATHDVGPLPPEDLT